jgi:hypothetical protein
VNQQTASGFILAGATAIGVGNELIPPEAIEMRESERIQELARRFVSRVKEARQQLPPRKEDTGGATDFLRLHKYSPTSSFRPLNSGSNSSPMSRSKPPGRYHTLK